MKTLIIHPEDSSTSFLDRVYDPIPNKTVVTRGLSKSLIAKMIEDHDRVMMMGHGSPKGLFSVGVFPGSYIIDASLVPLLRTKRDSVFIWCWASDFVKMHGLHGFTTGMFISEVGEAMFCGVPDVTQEMVDESNYLFVDELGRVANEKTELMFEHISSVYGSLVRHNPVAAYNHVRLDKLT